MSGRMQVEARDCDQAGSRRPIGASEKLADTEAQLTEAERKLAETQRELDALRQMVDQMPINVPMCDPADFTVTYINQTGVDTLRPLEHLLPVPADRLMGPSMPSIPVTCRV